MGSDACVCMVCVSVCCPSSKTASDVVDYSKNTQQIFFIKQTFILFTSSFSSGSQGNVYVCVCVWAAAQQVPSVCQRTTCDVNSWIFCVMLEHQKKKRQKKKRRFMNIQPRSSGTASQGILGVSPGRRTRKKMYKIYFILCKEIFKDSGMSSFYIIALLSKYK